MGMPTDGHHVGQGEHDDVGVGGRERHGDGGQRQQQPRRRSRPACVAPAPASWSGDVLAGAVVGQVERVGHRLGTGVEDPGQRGLAQLAVVGDLHAASKESARAAG